MINSYPSIFNLGHAQIADLLKGDVIVEEKIDGSQFSFSKNEAGELSCRSKGAQINMVAPEGMFQQAVEMVNAVSGKMRPGYTYRGEYLRSPKHNALVYDRIPRNHVILFDVNSGLETYLARQEKQACADELGLELVPELFRGKIDDVQQFRAILDTMSVLGGQKIEGVVIKPVNYDQFGRDKKCLMGKFVSEAFREVHQKSWDAEHKPKSSNDIIQILSAKFGTCARWQKALIHLRERGQIQDAPQDIGLLMKEVPEDVLKECEQEIKDDLFNWCWPHLRRMLNHGLPEWYKEELLKKQFETKCDAVSPSSP